MARPKGDADARLRQVTEFLTTLDLHSGSSITPRERVDSESPSVPHPERRDCPPEPTLLSDNQRIGWRSWIGHYCWPTCR